MKIYVNKNPAGKFANATFGLCEIADGILRVCTLGYFASTVVLDHTRRQAYRDIEKAKRRAGICD